MWDPSNGGDLGTIKALILKLTGAVRAGRRLSLGELAHCAVCTGGTRGGKLARGAGGAVARDLAGPCDDGLAN